MAYILGGIGLFLLGMNMLTNGLKELTGDFLKRWLNKFTGGTFSSVLSGSLITALIQSSSATTVLTIGFVSAGLLTFVQSIGVIIGANIGSTSTGWIVSLIGFKINLNAISLPIIGIGVLFTVFASKKYQSYGSILAGFGLLFLGIDILQQGMGVLENFISFDAISGDGLFNKLLLVIIGIIMTVVMQSSSAAVATTLTMLYAGIISFEQTAFLVIGQNVGTTVTAMLASIGASIPAKRTAVTHVIFNITTGTAAALLTPILLALTVSITTFVNGVFDPTLGIAIFHTLFNMMGALLFMPFIKPFSQFVLKIIPDKGNELTKHLDENVASIPSVATESTFVTLKSSMYELTQAIHMLFDTKKESADYEKKLTQVEDATKTMRNFLNLIDSNSPEDHNKHIAILHALDHLNRLVKVIKEDYNHKAINSQSTLINGFHNVLKEISPVIMNDEELIDIEQRLAIISSNTANERKKRRVQYFESSAKNETDLHEALSHVEDLLWIDRLIYHYWRVFVHMSSYLNVETEGCPTSHKEVTCW